uniref:Rx N-terminal domain-containing protein n=1 Tax=Leersia perrieri TaxID=77586 RepID=A0A0D9WUW5_9ORYZ
METILSAILGDITSRSMSFLINKCSKPKVSNMEERLQRLLLRVLIVVEEAEHRLITNQGMLLQLNILRKEMYRGYYTLDSFRCHGHEEEDSAKDVEVNSFFSQSKFNPAKRVRFCRVKGQSLQGHLQQVLGSVQVTVEDMSELVMLLNSCPRLCRQPYSMYLLLDKCLFGRQMEMEHIMNFLLKEDATGNGSPGILPIIGPAKVGKSTLIEHACGDEKVRTFRNMDAQEYPKLASIAMDMARELNGCFMGVSIYSGLLKANFSTRFWSMALARIREFKKTNLLVYGAYFDHPWLAVEPANIMTVNKTSSEYLVVLDEYQTCSVQIMIHRHTDFIQNEAEVPMLNLKENLHAPTASIEIRARRHTGCQIQPGAARIRRRPNSCRSVE